MTAYAECALRCRTGARACPGCGAPPTAAAKRSGTFLWLVPIALTLALFIGIFFVIDTFG